MEVEAASTPDVAKKLWNILRIVVFMLRKGISKSRIMVDLNWMLKRTNKLAGKAIGNLMYHHASTSFSCRSNEALNFVSPREYEFSCSNSPAVHYPLFHKRKHHHYHHHHNFSKSTYKYNDVTTVAAVQRMLEMLNNEAVVGGVEASPMTSYFPGFGKSPMVRQLRITDSPFPIKEEGDSVQVDKAAEDFIKKFYKDLKLQKNRAAIDSPYHHMQYMWGR